jgi:hypothetical protein
VLCVGGGVFFHLIIFPFCCCCCCWALICLMGEKRDPGDIGHKFVSVCVAQCRSNEDKLGMDPISSSASIRSYPAGSATRKERPLANREKGGRT